MLKRAKKLIGAAIFQVYFLISPVVVLAQSPTPGQIVPAETLGKVPDIIPVIQAIIRFILLVAFVIAFIMLLIGGIRWILAGGDEKAVAGARNTITAALIGLVIVLVAFAIIKLVETFFGFEIISKGIIIPTVSPGPTPRP